MSLNEYHLLIRHDSWANERLAETLNGIEELPDKSKKIFDHIIGAQHNWISRIKGEAPAMTIWPVLQSSTWGRLVRENREDLLSVCNSEDAMKRVITYKNSAGQEFSNPVSEIVLHLSLHSQYHRGQVVAYSRELLNTTPVTDMIAYLRI